MTQYEIPIIATSSEAAGAVNITNNGSSFEILLADPIIMPDNLSNCSVQVDEATVWWTIPNISAALGNNLVYVSYSGAPHTLTIPDGLYSITDLSSAIDREFLAATGVAGVISLAPDNATQKVTIAISPGGVATQIDFTQANTIRDIIGFNSQLVPPAPTAVTYSQLGDNVAAFNSIEFFLLHSDIVGQGIRVNEVFTQTIAQILIDVPPGSQIVSREYNPPKSDALGLQGTTIDRIRFWLTDQNNNLVDTHGEHFSCRIVIKYTL